MGNQLVAPSNDSTAPVAPDKRDVANRSAKAAENYSGVPNVGPGARSVDAACCPEEPPVNASDEESGRLYQTPDLFSLTSSRDSAYGTARTISMVPRGPEKLRMNALEDVMEDMDETIAPSGTVDPSKVTDESDDAASFHISDSDGKGFPVSPHTQKRASSLPRASVPHKSTKSAKTRVTIESSGEEFSASPHTQGRASSLHQNLPLSPRHTVWGCVFIVPWSSVHAPMFVYTRCESTRESGVSVPVLEPRLWRRPLPRVAVGYPRPPVRYTRPRGR